MALHDTDAERAVLCGCLLAHEHVGTVTQLIGDDAWTDERHRLLWRALVSAWMDGDKSLAVGTAERLAVEGTLERAGGASYLGEILDYEPSALTAQPVRRAQTLAELATKRRIRLALEQLHIEAAEGRHTGESLADRVLSVALELLPQQRRTGAVTIGEVAREIVAHADGYGKDESPALPTPWLHLTGALVGGLRPGKLYVVAGRPAMGKSVFGVELAAHAAERGVQAVVYSAEMDAVEIAQRILAARSGVPLGLLISRSVSQAGHHSSLQGALSTVDGWPLSIEAGALTITDVVSRSKVAKAAGKLGLVVVDYLQLLGGTGQRHASREQEVSEMSRTLKRLSVELQVPVVALAQLNRGLEMRQDKRPILSDLRESGAIEQDADAVIMLYRPSVYATEGTPDASDQTLEAIIRKQRGGPTATVRLEFDGRTTRIRAAQE